MIVPLDKERELAELVSQEKAYLASRPESQTLHVLDEVEPLSREVFTKLCK